MSSYWTARDGYCVIIFAALAAIGILTVQAIAQDDRRGTGQERLVDRGKYLVTIGSCTDCHTPGYFLGKPDNARFLGGSEVGFEIPGLGVFYGPNLTPDKETGLGGWTDEQIITAITTGVRPDGRQLVPAMPYEALSNLTRRDRNAIVAYLRSLPAVSNKVPGPFGSDQKPTSFRMTVLPPDE